MTFCPNENSKIIDHTVISIFRNMVAIVRLTSFSPALIPTACDPMMAKNSANTAATDDAAMDISRVSCKVRRMSGSLENDSRFG